MLQSMLFFGTWESISGDSISSRDFILSSTGPKLSSENLRSLIQRISKGLCTSNIPPTPDPERIFLALEQVESWQNSLLAEHPPQFSLVISLLRRQTVLVRDVLMFLYYCIPHGTRRGFTGFRHLNLNDGFYRDLLQEKKLCPSYYEYLDYVGVSVIEYFSVVDPTNKSQSNHWSCNASSCLVNRKTVGVGEANHLQPACVCQSVSILSTRAQQVLVSENYFVIDIIRLLDETSPPSEAIVPYRSGLTYVAFSHVWSHGLGNIADQGLPLCRLRYLKNLIFSLKVTFGPITHF